MSSFVIAVPEALASVSHDHGPTPIYNVLTHSAGPRRRSMWLIGLAASLLIGALTAAVVLLSGDRSGDARRQFARSRLPDVMDTAHVSPDPALSPDESAGLPSLGFSEPELNDLSFESGNAPGVADKLRSGSVDHAHDLILGIENRGRHDCLNAHEALAGRQGLW